MRKFLKRLTVMGPAVAGVVFFWRRRQQHEGTTG